MQSTDKSFFPGSTVLMGWWRKAQGGDEGRDVALNHHHHHPLVGVNKCRQSLYVIIYVITYLRTLGSGHHDVLCLQYVRMLVSMFRLQYE
jgi:hypothetical protein